MTASDPPADDRSVPRTVLAWGLAGLIPFLGLPLLAVSIPALSGWYVWGDYCSGQIQGLRVQDRALAQVLPLAVQSQNTAIRVGPDGELWAISIGGEIARIVAG